MGAVWSRRKGRWISVNRTVLPLINRAQCSGAVEADRSMLAENDPGPDLPEHRPF